MTGQRVQADKAVLACRIIDEDSWCRRCGEQGTPRDTVIRQLAHEPCGWRPTTSLVTIRRYRCDGCRHVWRQDSTQAADPRAELSRRVLRWALEVLVCQHLSVARVAEVLAVSWHTANNAVLAEGRRVLIEDPDRFGALKTWRADRPQSWRDAVEAVAMEGFTGFKTAATEEAPDAVAVMDPFHMVRLAGNALEECRRRVQLATHGHQGRKTDPLYASRQTLQTGADLLTNKQKTRLQTLIAAALTEIIALGRTLKKQAASNTYATRPWDFAT